MEISSSNHNSAADVASSAHNENLLPVSRTRSRLSSHMNRSRSPDEAMPGADQQDEMQSEHEAPPVSDAKQSHGSAMKKSSYIKAAEPGSPLQQSPVSAGGGGKKSPFTGGCPVMHGSTGTTRAGAGGGPGGCPVMQKTSSMSESDDQNLSYLFEELQNMRQEDEDRDDLASVVSGNTVGSTQFSEFARFRQFQILLDRFAEGCLFPVVMIDAKGQIRSVNRETLELFNYERWELIGFNIKLLMEDHIAAKHDYYLKRYVQTKCRRIIMEKRHGVKGKKKNGDLFPMQLRIQELDDMNGGSVFLGFIQDMSKELELDKIRRIFESMMPKTVTDRLKAGDERIADLSEATVIFADIVQFSNFAAVHTPVQVVELLSRIFKVFDIIAKKYGVEKVKTIGDCWMGVCGAVAPRYMDAPVRAVEVGNDMVRYMVSSEEVGIRVGIATGNVLSGCIDPERPHWDIWGNTVNLASRLQSLSAVNGILVDSKTFEQTNHMYIYKQPTSLDVKGIGSCPAYTWESKRKVDSRPEETDPEKVTLQLGKKKTNAVA
eukprot:ANDGO_08034.mRNA.1 Adenylate cyclase